VIWVGVILLFGSFCMMAEAYRFQREARGALLLARETYAEAEALREESIVDLEASLAIKMRLRSLLP
jgi:hypothetical protein